MQNSQSSAPVALNNIVIAVDFSPISETALLYSLAIARRNEAKVWIVHVVGDSFFSTDTQARALDDAWREGQRHMTEHLVAGHLDGVEHQLQVEQGNVFAVLSRVAEQHNADLLVLGTRGRSRIGKLLLGSVAETVFRQAPCPVMTVGPKTEVQLSAEGPKRILFCTGFSAHSIAAGSLALRLAERQEAELLLLHVAAENFAADNQTSREEYRTTAQQKMLALLPAENRLTMPPRALVEFGTAAERILAVAQAERPGLIVMGIRQPEGFALRLRWATAYAVVSEAPCPVLTVRTAGAGE